MANKKRSYKDVALDFIARVQVVGKQIAKAEVKAHVTKREISKRTLWKAAAFLIKEKGVDELQKCVDEHFPRRARGMPPPHVGEERDYVMQVDTSGRQFLKVPGKHLGVGVGGKARIRFEPGPKIAIIPSKQAPKKRKQAA